MPSASPERAAAWKRHLSRKGAEAAKALEDLLAGLEVDLAMLPSKAKPGEDKIVRTRQFLESIDRAIKAWGTEQFGTCKVCGRELAAEALDQAPWLDRCDAHRDS